MRYQRSKNVAWRRIGDQTVIVNLARRRMLALNESGAAVWDGLVKGLERSDPDAQGASSAKPSSPEGWIEFFADLEQEGVLERADEVPTGLVAGATLCSAGARPAVVWREELHRFGGSCGMLPYVGGLCDAKPTAS